MTNDNLIKEIVEQVWSDETIIIGETVTKDICKGISNDNLDYIEAKGGSDFNATETVQLIIQAATLVKLCLDIWKTLSEQIGRKPSPEEVQEKLNSDERINKIKKNLLEFIPTILSIIQRML